MKKIRIDKEDVLLLDGFFDKLKDKNAKNKEDETTEKSIQDDITIKNDYKRWLD